MVSKSSAGVPKEFLWRTGADFFWRPTRIFSMSGLKLFYGYTLKFFNKRLMKKNFNFSANDETQMKLQVLIGKGFIQAKDFNTIIQTLIDKAYETKSKR